MQTTRHLPILLACLLIPLLFGCRQRQPANINAGQSHNQHMQHILAPGFGTVGLIRDGSMHVFYQAETGEWLQDPGSRFDIPEDNQGLLAMGHGRIGVVRAGYIDMYRIGNDNQWHREEALSFALPRRFDRVTTMPLDRGISAIATERDGELSFYVFDGSAWEKDPSIRFTIPSGISGYYPLGDMTIAIRDDTKLGVYYLTPDLAWEFLDHDPFILLLPDGHQGVVPLDKKLVAVLTDGALEYFRLDLSEDRWLALQGSHFELPW